jgi:translation initiation factor 5
MQSGGRCNIPSTIQDPTYRYTMPRMILKQESRLNGVKTNITNLNEVAQALRVPPGSVIKFFCDGLGTSAESDTVVKGSVQQEKLVKLLDK